MWSGVCDCSGVSSSDVAVCVLELSELTRELAGLIESHKGERGESGSRALKSARTRNLSPNPSPNLNAHAHAHVHGHAHVVVVVAVVVVVVVVVVAAAAPCSAPPSLPPHLPPAFARAHQTPAARQPKPPSLSQLYYVHAHGHVHVHIHAHVRCSHMS